MSSYPPPDESQNAPAGDPDGRDADETATRHPESEPQAAAEETEPEPEPVEPESAEPVAAEPESAEPVDSRPRPRYGEYAPLPPAPRYGERTDPPPHAGQPAMPGSPAGSAWPGPLHTPAHPPATAQHPSDPPPPYAGQQGGQPTWQGAQHGQPNQPTAQGQGAPGAPGADGGTPPLYAPPPGYGQPPGYSPQGWSRYDPAPPKPKSGRMGLVALIIIAVVFVLSVIASVYVGNGFAPFVSKAALASPNSLDQSAVSRELINSAPGVVVVLSLQVLLGSILGILSLILGIAAVVGRRGRRSGIPAIVLSILAPIVSFIVYIFALRAAIG